MAEVAKPKADHTAENNTLTLPTPPHFLQSYLGQLLAKEPKFEADFTRVAAAVNNAKADGVTR